MYLGFYNYLSDIRAYKDASADKIVNDMINGNGMFCETTETEVSEVSMEDFQKRYHKYETTSDGKFIVVYRVDNEEIENFKKGGCETNSFIEIYTLL